MKFWLRRIHRWLGLLMAVQIVFWMASGLYFAWFPIETIRGEHLVRERPAPGPAALAELGAPTRAWSAVAASMPDEATLSDVAIVVVDGRFAYRVRGVAGGEPFARIVEGRDGTVRERLDAEGARARAEAHLRGDATAREVEWLTEAPPGSEYRGRPLPLWKVAFDVPERVNVYVEPWTGDVLAVRTTRWRVFDFLWMLHIMDFDTRDDFNTPLLQIAALLGLLIGLSGVAYWTMTTRLFRRRRSAAG